MPCLLHQIPSISLSRSYIGSSPQISIRHGASNAREASLAPAAILDVHERMLKFPTPHFITWKIKKPMCVSLVAQMARNLLAM